MDEDIRPAPESEAPINPYSLLEAVNRSARSAGRAWLAFLALAGYMALVLAAVTHSHLLLNTDVRLPLLNLDIGLTRFFTWAPILILFAHIGLLGQLVLLSRKALEFDAAVRLLESTDHRSHPLRLELENFFFVQVLAGPQRSRVVSAYLNGLLWLTVIGLPLILLLYFQVACLPLHNVHLTLVHKGLVVADLAMLALFGVFFLRPEDKYFSALARGLTHNPGSYAFGCIVFLGFAFLSIFVAAIPDPRNDRQALFVAEDGTLFGIFPRSIVASDKAFLAGKPVIPGKASVDLRGRDLRGARLERSDLRQADLTGANLDGANLGGADLRGVVLECKAPDTATAGDRNTAGCARARSANFALAQLEGARMSGIDLQHARLEGASMEGADITNGVLQGASLQGARLARAIMLRANLQGVNFRRANLQGADVSDASLQLANLSEAFLQGADFSRSTLDGAMLRSAVLDGADLRGSQLYGVDFSDARIAGADLSSARIWHSLPPSDGAAVPADLTQVAMKAPSDAEVGILKAAVASLDRTTLKDGVHNRIGSLTDATVGGSWSTERDGLSWTKLARDGEEATMETYRRKLGTYLADLACRAEFGDGAVASGIARRAVRPDFKGDAGALYALLKTGDCPASATVGQRFLRQLGTAVESIPNK